MSTNTDDEWQYDTIIEWYNDTMNWLMILMAISMGYNEFPDIHHLP